MKKFLFAASAAIMAATAAPAVQAADLIDSSALQSTGSDSFSTDGITGFTQYFDFQLFDNYDVSVGAYTSSFTGLKFTGLTIASWDGIASFGSLTYNAISTVSIFNGARNIDALIEGLGTGRYVLKFTGQSGTKEGTFGGDISIAAIPEPTTWAMMLVGVAAIGTTMRRRSQNVRVSFS